MVRWGAGRPRVVPWCGGASAPGRGGAVRVRVCVQLGLEWRKALPKLEGDAAYEALDKMERLEAYQVPCGGGRGGAGLRTCGHVTRGLNKRQGGVWCSVRRWMAHLCCWQAYQDDLERREREEREREAEAQRKAERKAREDFKQLLSKHRCGGLRVGEGD